MLQTVTTNKYPFEYAPIVEATFSRNSNFSENVSSVNDNTCGDSRVDRVEVVGITGVSGF